jgi:hypothetical protein
MSGATRCEGGRVGWRKSSAKGAERVSGSRRVGGWQESVVGLGERVPRGARRGFDRADQNLILG